MEEISVELVDAAIGNHKLPNIPDHTVFEEIRINFNCSILFYCTS